MKTKKFCTKYTDFEFGNMYKTKDMGVGQFIIYRGIYSRDYGLVESGYFYGLAQKDSGFILAELRVDSGWENLGNFEKKMLEISELAKQRGDGTDE